MTVLLGTGTPITEVAIREPAKAGVLVGFCGSGGAVVQCQRIFHRFFADRTELILEVLRYGPEGK